MRSKPMVLHATMKAVLGILLLASVGWARQIVPLPKNVYNGDLDDVNTNIVNGLDATPGQFPFQASIQYTSGSHVCGCSLITSRWLITAAHCISNAPSSYRVVLGLHDLSNYDNGGNPEIYQVSAFFLHPDYSSDPNIGFPNDVALINIASDANLANPFIETIAVAPDNGDDYLGASCFISGWGRLTGPGPLASILQYIPINVITNQDCASRTNPNWVSPIQICVFNGYSGPCYGDSGGPLMCERDGTKYLVGDSNWMIGECLVEYPSVYTRLSEYNDWINGIIN